MLREATPADAPALAALVEAAQATHREWAGERFRLPGAEEEELEWHVRFARSGGWVRCAVEPGGRIVGAVAFSDARERRGAGPVIAGLGHVSAVFVHPDRRREGIARHLVESAHAAMRAAGYVRAQLWTLEGSPAMALYEGLGWERDGRRELHPGLGLMMVAYVRALQRADVSRIRSR